MKIERHIKLLNCCPKIPVLGHVVKHDRVRIANLRKSIYKSTAKAQFFGAARQFLRSSVWVLEGQCGETLQAFRIFGDVFSQVVIRTPRDFDRLIGIWNRLDSRSDERDDANFNVPSVHLCDAPAAQVFDLTLKFRSSEGRVTGPLGSGKIEVFFQRDPSW